MVKPSAELQPSVPPEKRRDPFFDNARTILICLVVVGHVLQRFNIPSAHPLVLWIYAFHMPAFVLVSGHLARRFDGSLKQINRLISGIVVPYLVFQLIHAALRPLLLDEPFVFRFVRPAWTLWFLLALVIWRLATPLIRSLKYPITTAVIVSLIAPLGVGLDQDWSMARVLGFLPFYVIGVAMTPEHIRLIRSWVRPWLGYVILGGALLAAYVVQPDQNASLFFFDSNYADMTSSAWKGILIRFALVCIGLIGTLGVLSISSSKRNRLTRVGQYSLYVYLLHALVLFPVRELDLFDWMHSPLHMVIAIFVGLALAILMASPPVVLLTRWLIAPRWPERFLKQPPHPSERQTDEADRKSGSR